jgi:hypothetical protein
VQSVSFMSQIETVDDSGTDLEQGLPSETPKVTVETAESPDDEELPGRIGHTDEELLMRAREINSCGKFIFTCYSELNTFLLLRAQDDILKLQNKLHDSVKGKDVWTDEDSEHLQNKLRQYRTCRNSSQLTLDEALALHKTILTWEHPPFKASHSAGEFLFGKMPQEQLLHQSSFSFPSSVAFRPASKSVKDFDGSDYVDLCPQNSTPINSFLQKILPKHFLFHGSDGRVVAYLQTQNQSCIMSLNSLIF